MVIQETLNSLIVINMERVCFGSGGDGLVKWAVKLLSRLCRVYLQVVCCD
jgi:hypothetical protein